MRFFLVFMAVIFASLPVVWAASDDLTIDLAKDHVDITAGFVGSSVTLYGVAKNAGDIAVTLSGPERHMIVRRKGSVGGAWINRHYMVFRHVPVYYDYALSAPEVAQDEELQALRIGLDVMTFKPDTKNGTSREVLNFQEALIRNKQQQGLYPLHPKDITFLGNGLFKAVFDMPSNVPTGQYTVKVFSFDNGKLIENNTTVLKVAQVGFSAGIYAFAHEHGFVYGVFCVVLACCAGGLSVFLRRSS